MIEQYTKVQVSAKHYWGFNVDFPNSRLMRMSKDDIVRELVEIMKIFFESHNLLELKEGVDQLDWHIHQNIVPGQTIYVCAHDSNSE